MVCLRTRGQIHERLLSDERSLPFVQKDDVRVEALPERRCRSAAEHPDDRLPPSRYAAASLFMRSAQREASVIFGPL